MTRALFCICLLCTGFLAQVAQAQILPNFGGQRAGLSALSFLKNDMNTRSVGMAGASVALDGDVLSVASNPAALTHLDDLSFALAHSLMGAGIQQSLFSLQGKLESEATVGFSINSLNSGPMEIRTEFRPDGTGQYFQVGQHALGLNYAQKLSDMFNLGVNLKYILEQMGAFENHVLAFDIGFLYETDLKDLKFAVLLQNFGGNSAIAGDELQVNYNRSRDLELSRYTVPTVFKMGLSFQAWERDEKQIRIAAELNNPNDNAENLRIGAEFAYRNLLRVQGGVRLSVRGQTWPSFGFQYKARVRSNPIHLGYAVLPTDFMGVQHLFSLQFQRNRMKR